MLIVERRSAGEDWSAFVARNADWLAEGRHAALRPHYSPGVLASEEARQHFLPPDIR